MLASSRVGEKGEGKRGKGESVLCSECYTPTIPYNPYQLTHHSPHPLTPPTLAVRAGTRWTCRVCPRLTYARVHGARSSKGETANL